MSQEKGMKFLEARAEPPETVERRPRQLVCVAREGAASEPPRSP